jgi:eukaryotic-like serine/threonine-protein kinase
VVRRRRRWLLLIAIVLAALAASWYLADRDGNVTPEEVPSASAVGVEGGDVEPSPDTGRQTKVRTFYGLQTAVPETVGMDERNAIFAIEEGGFRARVMTRKVSASSDEGVVLQQLPRGGLTRRVGWIVTIIVGTLSG